MANKKHAEGELTLSAKILLNLFTVAEFMPRPFEHKTAYFKRVWLGKTNYLPYYKAMKRLEASGFIKIYKDRELEGFELTQQGCLEALFTEARIAERGLWDGKWTLIFFDIPEDARPQRNKLRALLKANGFKQMQKSVFISPYPFHASAKEYLKRSSLDKYIRIFRVEGVDDDTGLKKMFSL